ncbi:MAG: aminotransferase class V-fold PLP-dependent enzyme [Candidatus Eisenbacteria bacterium]
MATRTLEGPLVRLDEATPGGPVRIGDEAGERAFLDRLRAGVIGAGVPLDTPEGPKRLAYFDWTASGRFHREVEDVLNTRVLPYMANTHSETSATGRMMTRWYEDAFRRIAGYLGAREDDVVLPVGSGSTGAVNRLIQVMGLRIPSELEDRYDMSRLVPEELRPVVFRSSMEHHSNDITWRETIGETVFVPFDEHGRISVAALDELLGRYRARPNKIGTFSAASNVTGIRNDCHALARVLHRHGAWAFFDYAAAGPYVDIDLHPMGTDGRPDDEARLDAVFLSVHKFLGGPRAPGLLVANRRLFSNRVPAEPGGGTVLYTSPTEHVYLRETSHRETGGTPPVVGAIQAGLAFDLKHAIGTERIHRIERGYLERALTEWRRESGLELLGDLEAERLGIVSMIFHGLHHNYVVALLNDYFGVQARGGCMCAGPYGHELLDIDPAVSERVRRLLEQGHCGLKPGWVRVGFSPVTSETEFQTLLEAVRFVCREGRRHLPRYEMIDETGEWRRRGGPS